MVRDELLRLLSQAFTPVVLDVQDQTADHYGHRESQNGPETHFKVLIVSLIFEGKSRLSRHKKVYQVIRNLWGHPLHALSLNLQTPAEYYSHLKAFENEI